jgi:hypothetical protein
MKKNMGMAPYWRGGVPVERGDYPAVLEWRPQREKTDNPEIFQGWISDIESVLAMTGLSLVTQQTGGGTIIFSAAGHKVAELRKTMDGIEGTVFSRPVGGPGPGAAGQVAAEQIRRSSQWLGYGQGEYYLAPTERAKMTRVTGTLSILPVDFPPFEQSGASKAKIYGGAALGAAGLLGGIVLALTGKGQSKWLFGGGGLLAAGGGGAITYAGVKQKREEEEAYEEAYIAASADNAAAIPTLPQTAIIEDALARTRFLKRTLIFPGATVTSASGVDPVAGDWEATVYDKQRKSRYTILCTDVPRTGMRELVEFYVSDPGTGVASAMNRVSFTDEWNESTLSHPVHDWGRGDKTPRSVRDQIWALPVTRDGEPTNYGVAKYVQNLAASMNRPLPKYAMSFSGSYGGPLVRTDRAFSLQTNLWRDVFSSVFWGVIKMAAAVIIGFLGAGPVGSAIAIAGVTVSIAVAEIIGIVGYLAYEAYKIYKEVKKTGRISGNMEDAHQIFSLLAAETGTIDAYLAQFGHEINGLMSFIDSTKDAGRVILEQYRREIVNWTNGLTDEIEKIGAQMVAGAEGGLAAFASRINGYPKTQIPWTFPDGAVRLLEAKIEGGVSGSLPSLP